MLYARNMTFWRRKMVCYCSVLLHSFNLYFSLLFTGIPVTTGSLPIKENSLYFHTTEIHAMKPPVWVKLFIRWFKVNHCKNLIPPLPTEEYILNQWTHILTQGKYTSKLTMPTFETFCILTFQTFHHIFFLEMSCRLPTSARPCYCEFLVQLQISKNCYN